MHSIRGHIFTCIFTFCGVLLGSVSWASAQSITIIDPFEVSPNGSVFPGFIPLHPQSQRMVRPSLARAK